MTNPLPNRTERARPSLADKVAARVRSWRTAQPSQERDGHWLNDAIAFNPQRACPAPELLDELLDGRRIYKRHAWERDLSQLLGNLMAAHKAQPPRPLMLSMNEGDYDTPPRYGHPRRKMLDLVRALHEHGLIGMTLGTNLPHLKRHTRIWILPRLLELYPDLPAQLQTRPPVEPLALREPQTGRLLDYTDTPETNEWRRRLQALNEINEAATILYFSGNEIQECPAYMRAVFTGDFAQYGRLESEAQQLSLQQRRTILADGLNVVEIGYRALQLHILYAAEGVQYPGDPYDEVINSVPGMHVRDPHAPTRSYLRHLLLASLGVTAPSDTARARRWTQAMQRVHERLEPYFAGDAALRILNREMRIALDVLGHFSDQGVPIISVHDSFIVPALYGTELWRVMDQTYQQYNDGFACPIRGPRRCIPKQG